MVVKLFCAVVGVGRVFSVDVELSATADELKDKIKEKKPSLVHFEADLLKLYLAREGKTWLNSSDNAFRALKQCETLGRIKSLMVEEQLLDETATLDRDDYFGSDFNPKSEEIHVLVELPSQVADGKPSSAAIVHSEQRLKRWRELNEAFDMNNKTKMIKMTTGDDGSTEYSDVRWSDVESLFQYELYKQERQPIPEAPFKFLIDYLKVVSHAMNGYPRASQKAQHFIAPVFVMLCSLFDDAELEVDVTVDGREAHACGEFEFVLTRGKTKICIVEAKNDFKQATVHALIGCEAVADREGLAVVYGIVTDFFEWYLYRLGDDSIEMDSVSLSVQARELDVQSMRVVCEMIYGTLSDHGAE